jgi:hypothetical protein
MPVAVLVGHSSRICYHTRTVLNLTSRLPCIFSLRSG